MLKGRKILITGVTGKAVVPIAAALARDNEVWGQARFERLADREAISALGIHPCAADLATGDLDALPADVDYLLHFAWMRGDLDKLDEALRVNVEGAGLVLHHCRNAKAALIVSSSAIYSAVEDPWHSYAETDPIGPGATCTAATSPVCKAGLETMARFASRAYGLPTTIARLNTVVGPHKAFFGKHLDGILSGREISLPSESYPHSPIHSEDMIRHIEPFLNAAGRHPLTVNWCGDEVIIARDAIVHIGERAGKPANVVGRPSAGLAGGNINDVAARRAITGPCLTDFWDGLERMLDEMLDGARCPLAQRSWDYGSAQQNVIFRGAA